MTIGRITQLNSDRQKILQHVVKASHLMTIQADTEPIVDMLVETDADWTEVLRFLGAMAKKQHIQLDNQKISELVAERLGGF